MFIGLSRQARLPILLAATLILAATVWPAGSGATAASPAPRTLHTLIIPAADFVPTSDIYEYVNSGYEFLQSRYVGGYIAPVHFPHPTVTVKRVTLYAYDNGAGDVCVWAMRARPAQAGNAAMGQVCSAGQSATTPRAFTATALGPRVVNSAYHGFFLQLVMPAGIDYRLFGVRVIYEA